MTDYRSEYNDSLNPKSVNQNEPAFTLIEGHTSKAQEHQLHAYNAEYIAAPQAVVSSRNSKAVISFILSLVGLVGGIATGVLLALAIPGVVLGHMAYKETNQNHQTGKGFALTGIILGYCSIVLMLVLAVIVLLIFVLADLGIFI